MKPTKNAYRIPGGHRFEVTEDGSAHLWDDSLEESVIDTSRPIIMWIDTSDNHFMEGALIPVTGGDSCTEPAWGAVYIAAKLGMEITLSPVGKHPSFKVSEVTS